MMSIQARESFVPHFGISHPLRAYPVNSPRAKARLIALALLADGRLETEELEALGKYSLFHKLGLSHEDFFQVLLDFCADVTHLPDGKGNVLISPQTLAGLLAEVQEPAQRKLVMRMIFDIIRSDHHLAEGERRLFWNAIDAWKLSFDEWLPVRHGREHERPENHYG